MCVKKYSWLMLLFACSFCHAQRVTIDFDNNWKFQLGNDSMASQPTYDDTKWRKLNLPHDWSIEQPFDAKAPATTQGGALPGGIGWYRKTFVSTPSFKGQKISIEFDGIYRNSEVWINGHHLGKRPNGYSSFAYDLSDYLNPANENNIIAVRADNSQQPNSRWYTGSGIYRNVRLVLKDEISIRQWGVFVNSKSVSTVKADINITVDINKPSAVNSYYYVQGSVYDAAGILVATSTKTLGIVFKADSAGRTRNGLLTVPYPHLWSVNDPYLYKLVMTIFKNGKAVDEVSTSFGIRYFSFDREKGFSLNGMRMKILGVCMHHDLGALGAAFNIRAAERQLQLLKQMGCNAIRTAHNPPAPEFLDLCDRMGFLVMDEAFDMWRKKKNKFDYALDFDKWHEADLADMIIRDRNHPSIIMWSIGNEIREQFDSSGIAITKELVSIVKKYDRSRPITSAITETDTSKNFIYQSGALDVIGFNYNQAMYPDFLKKYPGKSLIASETMSAIATRGHYDMPSDSIRRWPPKGKKEIENGNPDFTVSAYDNVSAYWGSTHEETWKIVKKYDFISGLFVWTGFDYLGEPTPYPWPARSSYFGILDLAGFPKDAYYMYQSEWTNKPVLHLFPHWNHKAGELVDVWAYYNNADEVELYLNGRSLGKKKKQGDELHVMWRVPFEPGVIKAVSRKNGQTVLVKENKTAGPVSRIVLEPDRKWIRADGKDLCFVTISLQDKDGNIVPNAGNELLLKTEGPGELIAMDNGYQADTTLFKNPSHKAYNGLCLAVIRADSVAGTIKITVASPGLKQLSCTVLSRR